MDTLAHYESLYFQAQILVAALGVFVIATLTLSACLYRQGQGLKGKHTPSNDPIVNKWLRRLC